MKLEIQVNLDNDCLILPDFPANKMYLGMKSNKKYKVSDLQL